MCITVNISNTVNFKPWLKLAIIIFLGSIPFTISASTIEDTLAEDS